MDDDERRDRQFAFEQVACLYDQVRPGYPGPLFDDLVAWARLERGDRVLEIGAGTGIATRQLVARGLAVTAVEPGDAMRRVAQSRPERAAAFVAAKFEDVPATGDYRAVVAAQAFHWIDPAIRLQHTAAMLEPGGTFALIDNLHDLTCPFRRSSEPVYRRVLGPPRPRPPRVAWLVDEMRASSRLCDVVELRYPWVATYTTQQLVALVSTFSDTVQLDEERRAALLEGLAEAVEQLGGTTPYHRTARLLLARRV